ncbi:MAG: helix-turn-helix transcriptional regulator [Firmicutes bacterium]|nr:helix-turn-helix transcriptional regulator [Bacillota bacterium]
MPQYRADILIKELRAKKGLTQQELAQGICSNDTLSRIERGERVPSKFVFDKLMQRLGEDAEQYHRGVITKSNKVAAQQKNRIAGLLRVPTAENLAEVDEMLATLENSEFFGEDGEYFQYFLLAKTTRLIHQQNFAAAHSSVLAAIKVTIPSYNEGDDISTHLLTFDEMRAFNILAGLLEMVDTVENSAKLYLDIIVAVELNFLDSNNLEFIVQYSGILYNASRQLIQIGDFEQCIAICDKCTDFSFKHGESYNYSLCMINKAHSLLKMGQKEEGKALYQDAVTLLRLLRRTQRYEMAKKYALDYHGLELE